MASAPKPGFHYSGQARKRLSYDQVKSLAQAYGLPGDAIAQIAKGESGLYADVQQKDPGDGNVGYGLLQMTPNAWGKNTPAAQRLQQLGGIDAMQDPAKNMAMARFLYKSAGNSLQPWHGTRFLTNRSGEGKLGPVDRSRVPADLAGGFTPQQSQGRAAAAGPQTVTTPGVDNSDARRQMLSQFLLGGGTDPTTGQQQPGGDILDFALQMKSLADVPGQTTTPQAGRTAPSTPSGDSGGGSGAHAALSWAQSKLGEHESGGANQGKLPGYLNQRFGMSGQPWCAMFTSAAVTKGGAPASARTASVAAVRQKAAAGDGYQRGLLSGDQAKPGDLILFGTSHIGMVKSVSGGKITYVGGNQSDAVTTGQVPASGATIARPKYGAR